MFKKSVVIGIAVTPERGLEVAEIDYATGTVLKYGSRQIDYNVNAQEIGDIDLFKDSLSELLLELGVSKSDIVLSLPTIGFSVNEYPASLEDVAISNAVEEELYEIEKFKSYDPCYSVAEIPSASMQFRKVAYSAVVKSTLVELILFLKDLGHRVIAVDTSVSSVLNSLVYLGKVKADPDMNWVLMIVENNCVRILSMLGKSFLDSFTEKIAISEVLTDAENYGTILEVAEPILKNLPSKYLCVVSKTNVISAKILADKISYSSSKIHQEANNFLDEPFLELAPSVDPDAAKKVSLDVIGAGIYDSYIQTTPVRFNLYNATLGDVFLNEQPPEITLFGKRFVLSKETLISYLIIFLILYGLIVGICWFLLHGQIQEKKNEKANLEAEIERIEEYIRQNQGISDSMFDEGVEIATGLTNNKNIYSYYTIVGTEIPRKLWLTHLKLGETSTIEGQADNLESVYAFFRSIKDYNPNSDIKLQKLGLAAASSGINTINDKGDFDTESLLTTLNADFYEFKISNEPEEKPAKENEGNEENGEMPLEPIN